MVFSFSFSTNLNWTSMAPQKSAGQCQARINPSVVLLPIGSMYGIFTYIWVIFRVNVSKYSIHGAFGLGKNPLNNCSSTTDSGSQFSKVKSWVGSFRFCIQMEVSKKMLVPQNRWDGWFIIWKIPKSNG